MRLFIELPPERTDKKKLVHLKNFLEKEHINGVQSINLDRENSESGEMGSGVVNTLTAVLIGVAGPFSRLAEAFTRYASSFRTELIIKNEHGDELILNTKKLDKEGIDRLVDQFVTKSKSKELAETEGKSDAAKSQPE